MTTAIIHELSFSGRTGRDASPETQRPLLKEEGNALVPATTPLSSINIAGITIDRELITIAGLVIMVGIVTALAGTAGITILAAIATAPVWIPIAVLSCPLWLPLAFFTSPVWVSAGTLLVFCALWIAFLAVLAAIAFLFFSWPAKWLPDPEESHRSAWFLCKRDESIAALIKLQAKMILYMAGVGPLADAALAIFDRIDLVELQKALNDFDLAEFSDSVKRMDIKQLQGALVGAVKSVLGKQ